VKTVSSDESYAVEWETSGNAAQKLTAGIGATPAAPLGDRTGVQLTLDCHRCPSGSMEGVICLPRHVHLGKARGSVFDHRFSAIVSERGACHPVTEPKHYSNVRGRRATTVLDMNGGNVHCDLSPFGS